MAAVLGVGLGALAAVRSLDGRDDPTEPATAQALAAAVRRHMPTEARLIRARDGGGSPSKHVAVILEYEIGGNPVSLKLEANNDLPWPGDYDGCTSPPGSGFTCEIRTLEGGTKLAVALGGPDRDHHRSIGRSQNQSADAGERQRHRGRAT